MLSLSSNGSQQVIGSCLCAWGVGHAVWRLLEIPGSAQHLAAFLAKVFTNVAPDRQTTNIAALMGDLLAQGFLAA